jgi:hypothetical protein
MKVNAAATFNSGSRTSSATTNTKNRRARPMMAEPLAKQEMEEITKAGADMPTSPPLTKVRTSRYDRYHPGFSHAHIPHQEMYDEKDSSHVDWSKAAMRNVLEDYNSKTRKKGKQPERGSIDGHTIDSEKQCPFCPQAQYHNASGATSVRPHCGGCSPKVGSGHSVQEEDIWSEVDRDRESIDELPAAFEGHLGRILIYLSLLAPFLSLAITLYAVVVLFVQIFRLPFALFRSKSSSISLRKLLSPATRLQLYLIYTRLPALAPSSEKNNHHQISVSYSPLWLTLTNLLSPVISFAIMVASWVAASFWLYTAILGEPALGTAGDGGSTGSRIGGRETMDSRDQDGRAAVRGVTKWWERWLMLAVKETRENRG